METLFGQDSLTLIILDLINFTQLGNSVLNKREILRLAVTSQIHPSLLVTKEENCGSKADLGAGPVAQVVGTLCS